MSTNGYRRPAGLRQLRTWVIVVAVLVVAALASVTAAALRGGKTPESPEQASAERSEQPTPSDSATPTSPPDSSSTPTATTSGAPAQSTTAGQPASAPKPRITSFSKTFNGPSVTVTFTLAAQADRGPFTCNVRSAYVTEDVPCSIGPNSRTYTFGYCRGSEIHIIATDRFGVRSDQWNGEATIPCADPPTYSNLRGWHDGSLVHIEFDVTAAPGDNPRCEIDASEFPNGVEYKQNIAPCDGPIHVSFAGPTGTYHVGITIKSDSHWNPVPELPAIVRVQ